VATAFECADDFDLVHNHFDFLPLTYSRLVTTPLVTTVHGFSSERILPVYRRYDDHTTYVAISDADRHHDLTYAATVPHGLPVEDVPVGPGSQDGTLVYLGRIHPDKGAARAIEVARLTGRPLVLAGIVQDAAYFEAEVRPHLDGERVRYVGPVGPEERDRLLGTSDALLHLVSFAEPFGLTLIEAMSCGTPVIATPLGAVPEVVADGRTGFLVHDVSGAVRSVQRLGELDRAACRAHVEEHFSVDRMVDGYLEVYRRVLSGG
jgi:glycosyltransferase involved in cell wall biosynthesis